ncbi:MAG: hypothetical protein DDT37_01431 [Firmicutes bacterium]|nr:hypothetical protein [candidate division NPL-UPA2 bacterium]
MEELMCLCRKHGIKLMYVFGSRVGVALEILSGHQPPALDPLADLDIGVVLSTPLPQGIERARLYSLLFNDLEDLFLPFAVDLVLLEENHSVFQAEAVRGRCIFAASLEAKYEYEESVLRRSADFRPFLERYYAEHLEVVTRAQQAHHPK